MKLVKIFFLSLIICSFNIYCKNPERRDGNWWNNLDNNSKYDYIVGFFDGMDLGNLFSYWGISDIDKHDDCVSSIIESYNEYSRIYFKNVSNIQLVDGLNEFYSDYRNRKIKIAGAIWLVVNSISGKPNDEFEKMIESWRKNADN
jgi:hypothetical protein